MAGASANRYRWLSDGKQYRSSPPLTGDKSVVAEVSDVAWPELLDAVDDEPPATTILSATLDAGHVIVRGISHDNGEIAEVEVNGKPAEVLATASGVVDWQVTLECAPGTSIVAGAKDRAGNVEQTPHRVRWVPPIE